MRYPDADIEVEYLKEKAKQKERSFKFDAGAPQVLREPRITGASTSVVRGNLISPDAWNSSVKDTASLTFEGV